MQNLIFFFKILIKTIELIKASHSGLLRVQLNTLKWENILQDMLFHYDSSKLSS